jgi:hypothetical protein
LYWTYAPWVAAGAVPVSTAAAARRAVTAHWAGALYRADPAIRLAWGFAEPGETGGHHWPPEFAARVCAARWIDLQRDALALERFLAVSVSDSCAVLPAPTVERCADGRATLWVSMRKFAVVRLANEIDPECSGFDECFERSGIEVR